MNIREWCRDIIRRPDRVAIPIMTHPGIEEMPYTVRQAITDGSIHAQAIKYKCLREKMLNRFLWCNKVN